MPAVGAPERLHVRDAGREVSYGFNQEWYQTRWQRMAGCGPTVAAEQLCYINQDPPALGLPHAAGNKSTALDAMELTWHFVTPGIRGLNTTARYAEGVSALCRAHGVRIRCRVLDAPRESLRRPTEQELVGFIAEGLSVQCPVAFLNLHAAGVERLEDWHWVLLMAVDERTGEALCYDQEETFTIPVAEWLRGTVGGGGFVWLMRE